MTPPSAAASTPPASIPIQGETPQCIESSVVAYPPTPTKAAWPAESWPA